mmetsp:Transcript_113959/g.362386  ORF Transcript_113959/g.362386 Transcript_113959/m.362386 type:complete len:348 (+) Transcript_113959:1863-2906(+)
MTGTDAAASVKRSCWMGSKARCRDTLSAWSLDVKDWREEREFSSRRSKGGGSCTNVSTTPLSTPWSSRQSESSNGADPSRNNLCAAGEMPVASAKACFNLLTEALALTVSSKTISPETRCTVNSTRASCSPLPTGINGGDVSGLASSAEPTPTAQATRAEAAACMDRSAATACSSSRLMPSCRARCRFSPTPSSRRPLQVAHAMASAGASSHAMLKVPVSNSSFARRSASSSSERSGSATMASYPILRARVQSSMTSRADTISWESSEIPWQRLRHPLTTSAQPDAVAARSSRMERSAAPARNRSHARAVRSVGSLLAKGHSSTKRAISTAALAGRSEASAMMDSKR